VLDLLGALINKSLAQAETREEDTRYTVLETVRQYGREKLEATSESDALANRHLSWYLALAEEAEPELVGPEQGRWLARLAAEHDNLRAALRWAMERGGSTSDLPQSITEGLRLAGALWRFWYTRGHLSEGRAWLERLLEKANSAGILAPEAQAKALRGSAVLATSQGDHEAAGRLCEQSLTLYRDLSDKQGIAISLNILGNVAVNLGDHARAIALSEESLALHRELGAPRGIAVALNNLGSVLLKQNHAEQAGELFAESLVLNRELGDNRGSAIALTNLGEVARRRNDYGQAILLCEESLALTRDLHDAWGSAAALNTLGDVARDQNDILRATKYYQECLALREELGDAEGSARLLHTLSELAPH